MREWIVDDNDVMKMLDSWLRDPKPFWEGFYKNRERKIPIFTSRPDESLVSYVHSGRLKTGKALDIGCGAGRNAIYLASNGWEVDAMDLSSTSLKWAGERAEEAGATIRFFQADLLEHQIEKDAYDLVYDSGCFHHIAPHRRTRYREVILNALKQDGYYGLACFCEDGEYGGATLSDWEIYQTGSLHGGMGYTEEKLIRIFECFTPVEIRKMVGDSDQDVFESDGLWAALFKHDLPRS
ncbi:class I SAM-dependent methyltransferase [Rossellomorea marisflavi]|uniref:class I SAM-dependent methyltransferase n=1 Tax=Rossellomorea marisflavi TaxID=189381 RepID=UPI0025B1E187|nr:class I SAM-dependent methyltransferase [Rossellomorea marisflavi]WJV16877.1 class I SAM-dependent methyltransferase [Rossellomorea marisflavi]